jgi:hypothetical protein
MTAATIDNPGKPAQPAGWPGAVLGLVAAALLCWGVITQPQRGWTPPAQVPVQLGEQHYRLDAARLEWLEAFSRLHFSAGQADGRALLEAELDSGLRGAFDEVSRRLPEFADWYYSLGGEYSRLAMTALAWLNRADDGYVARRAAEILFPAEAWGEALDGVERQAVGRLLAQQQAVREGWLAEIAARLAPHQVPAPLDSSGTGAAPEPVRLDALDARVFARERAALETRVAASSLVAGGVAARVAWRGVAGSGRAVAARGVGRGASKAVPAASGALAACSAAGPYALGCAVVAGAAAWVATDWLLLRVDEAMNRDDLLAALEAGLVEVRRELLAEMMAAYDTAAARLHGDVEAEITHTFRPARAGLADAAIVDPSRKH